MKRLTGHLLLFSLTASLLIAGDRKVLLEVFTNAHCYSCVAAYEMFRQYESTNRNAVNTSFVLYHIAQPGVEDSIYYENKTESDLRSAYYGSINAAPLLFTDGMFTGSNTKTWQNTINAKFSTQSPLSISIKGSVSGPAIFVDASVTSAAVIPDNDLKIFIVLTESVSSYVGKNGVTPQIYAMRKMMTGAAGQPLSISPGETKTVSAFVNRLPHWDKEKLWITAFVQSASKRTVYQSEMVSTSFFTVTSVRFGTQTPETFELYQNHPNPFNPSTTISFQIPAAGFVSLTVNDILGNSVAIPVKGEFSPGRYSIPFDASSLSSGIYFYTLRTGSNISTRKMLLLR